MNKPELDLNLKARFFALYHGQQVSCRNPCDEKTGTLYFMEPSMYEHFKYCRDTYLILRPIKSLSGDEILNAITILTKDDKFSRRSEWHYSRGTDCIEFSYGQYGSTKGSLNFDGSVEYFREVDCGEGFAQEIQELDSLGYYQYLISLSIALPLMGFSLQEMQEAGFFKF